MQTAHVLVHLAGDSGNTVPKRDVTAAEIAVLRAIHGAESVQEVAPAGDIDRPNREELSRLRQIYGKARREDCPVESLFPGAAARVFEDLAELELPEPFYKAVTRAEAPAPTARKTPARKGSTAKPAADEGDGIGEMNDGILG
jgi:hypothetical protein